MKALNIRIAQESIIVEETLPGQIDELKVPCNLTILVMAIDGTVVMTPQLLEDLDMVYDARIPRNWTHDRSGAEISWLVPNLGAWFTGLLDRVQQLSTWLEYGGLVSQTLKVS